MKRIETTDIDAPAVWANYFVNNDTEGLTPDELTEANTWLETEGLKAIDCFGLGNDENMGIGYFDYPLQGTLQCEMYTYTFRLGE